MAMIDSELTGHEKHHCDTDQGIADRCEAQEQTSSTI